MFQQVPVAFTMMADLGAEVIKIERPGTGEPGRGMQLLKGSSLSPYFETNNRGFKSLTLDLQKEKGLNILYKLVKDADIFSQNFRPGVAERRHFAYEDLVKINPGIIYLASSAYGRTDQMPCYRGSILSSRLLVVSPAFMEKKNLV
jgi:crotonobetainyl-CoA:carnitine CoA-transferase CaiB-like acyl-CoA transferase